MASSSLSPFTSKTVIDMMYTGSTPTGRTCRACNKFVKQAKDRGYQNLLSHLTQHPEHLSVVTRCHEQQRDVTASMFANCDGRATYGWMELVVLKGLSFADVDDDCVRRAVKYASMSSKTLKARMKAAVTHVEPALRDALRGEKFALVFDGLTDAA